MSVQNKQVSQLTIRFQHLHKPMGLLLVYASDSKYYWGTKAQLHNNDTTKH